MRTLIGVGLLLPLLAACSDAGILGAAAAEKRRVMNDMQARATMAAVCDISLGAYFRELNAAERRYAGLVCGDAEVLQTALTALPAQLHAPEPGAVPGRGEGTRY